MGIANVDYRLDIELHQRHFEWGPRLFATDLDGLLLECSGARPVALIEYKHRNWKLDLDSFGVCAVRNLADMAGLPFFLCHYHKEPFEASVYPINKQAVSLLPRLAHMTEREWAAWLHRIRGEEAPAEVLERLHDWETQVLES